MNITTTYKTNGSGTGQIVAKCNKMQKTTNYDPALSSAQNHGVAAANMVLKVAEKEDTKWLSYPATTPALVIEGIEKGRARHEVIEAGRHKFSL